MLHKLHIINLTLTVLIFAHANSVKLNHTDVYAQFFLQFIEDSYVRCVYILSRTNKENKIFIHNILKIVQSKMKVTTNFFTFDNYLKQHDEMSDQKKCSVPLQVIFADDNIEFRDSFALYTNSSMMFGPDRNGGGIWLVFLVSIDDDIIQTFFKNFNLPFDVLMIAAKFNNETQEITMKEVYRISPDDPLKIEDLGNWHMSPQEQIIAPHYTLVFGRRNNLNGKLLKLAYVQSDPYLRMMKTKDNITLLTGYFGDILQNLASLINFTLTYQECFENGIEKNNSWNGFVGYLSRREVDLGLSELAWSPIRAKYIDFSFPIKMSSFQMYFQNPGSMVEPDTIFQPLGFDIWIALILWIIFVPMILHFGCYLSDKYLMTSENVTPSFAMLSVVGALCCQGSSRIPALFACRTLFLMSFLINAVMIPSYSASLTSFLTMLPPIVPFRSMREFYLNGNYKMTVLWSSYEYNLFSKGSSLDPYIELIFRRDIESVPYETLPRNTEQAIDFVCRDKSHVYFSLSSTVDWAIADKIRKEGKQMNCTFSTSPSDTGKVSMGLTFPKYSHYKGLINDKLTRMWTSGIMKRAEHQYWTTTKVILPEELTPVEIRNVFMIFVLLLIGYLLAIAICIFEITYSKSNKNGETLYNTIRTRDLSRLILFYNPKIE